MAGKAGRTRRMKNKGNAALTAATVKGGKLEQMAERTAINSAPDSIMKHDNGQGLIESLLKHGGANAVSAEYLMSMTKLDLRQLRKQVELERRNGTLILTQPQGGYFLLAEGEKGKQEILQFYRIQRAKALSLLKTISAARNALEAVDGQEEFEI